jgi:hypothetical protein
MNLYSREGAAIQANGAGAVRLEGCRQAAPLRGLATESAAAANEKRYTKPGFRMPRQDLALRVPLKIHAGLPPDASTQSLGGQAMALA